MNFNILNKHDEMVMKLAHYFITEENYTPIVVKGCKDEIWLENVEGPFRIIRINYNYIHNKEQYDFDLFKAKNVMHQIKKKTLSPVSKRRKVSCAPALPVPVLSPFPQNTAYPLTTKRLPLPPIS